MAVNEIFESSIHPKGDLAGVYEYDGETGYFYLYQIAPQGNKVLAAIHMLSGTSDLSPEDIEILWDGEGENVGLFIHMQLWAVFDARDQAKYGGDYKVGSLPQLPAHAISGFGTVH